MAVPTVLSRCLNPKRIVNPYTHQTMFVPCGHCQACSLTRNNHLSLLCDLEAKCHKYCMFITLTYANRYIPRAKFVDSIDRPFGCDLVDADGEIIAPVEISHVQREKLLEKFYLFGDVPYLRKSDLQKFFKRFRFYARKITDAKVRYFACGEYGPVHFRPHFHILLYFSDETLFQACEQIVLESWPFGRVDVQTSRGNCSSYVASYVNSSVFVPQVFKTRSIRPFCVHSQKLGQGILQGQRKEIYALPAEQVIKRSIVVNEKYREFNMWRSYYAYYFPKCRGYFGKSSHERTYAYRVYDYARKVFPDCQSTLDLARRIAYCCYYFPFSNKENDLCYTEKITRDLLRYFYDSDVLELSFAEIDGSVRSISIYDDCFDLYVHRIYIELLLSKHFLYFVCDNQSVHEIMRKVKIIEEFYKQLDYMNLTSFFENQSAFFESDLIGSDDIMKDDFDNNFYPYFYDNVSFNLADYKATPAFKVMASKSLSDFEARCKHKKLNDINKLLFVD